MSFCDGVLKANNLCFVIKLYGSPTNTLSGTGMHL